MFESIWQDIKREYNYGNMVTRLIIVNTAVFLLVNIVKLIFVLTQGFEPSTTFTDIIRFFSLSSDWWFNLTHPWVIFTSMFLHEGFLHFLFNMLFLYWFGRIVGDLLGNQRILPLYLLGGLMGALFYLLFASTIYAGGGYAYGASGAVMAVVVASGMVAPEYNMRLLLIGDVKLKYVVFVLVLIDLIGIANLSNTGGRIAHLGGALMGFLFVWQLRNGRDLSVNVNKILDSISGFFTNLFRRDERRPKVVYRNPKADKEGKGAKRSVRGNRKSDAVDQSHQERLDAILEKIKKTGYDNLTEEEKEFLFNASKK